MRVQRIAAALLLCTALTACSKHPTGTTSPDSSSAPVAPTAAADEQRNDPCSLLEPKEVEAVLGAPLGTPPYRGSSIKPAEDGSDCVYQSANFQIITLHVEYEGGPQAYHIGDFVGNLMKAGPGNVLSDKAKKAMVSEDGSQIAGEWDEAKLTPMTCCDFNALRADQMISIDFTGSGATLKQAAGLVDTAFKRLDKPLALDGNANLDKATAFLKTHPVRRDPCSLLSQADAEAILGKLKSAPVAQGDTCTYELPSSGMPRIYQLDFRWNGGNSEFRNQLHAAGIAGAALGSMQFQSNTQQQVADAPPAAGATDKASTNEATPAPPTHSVNVTETVSVDEASRRISGATFTHNMHLEGESGGTAGPWERAATVGPKFQAVKKDVLLQVDLRGAEPEKAQALAAAVMQKL